MTESILHISDTLLGEEQYKTDTETQLGGIKPAIDRAIELQVDAVIHTGNLFRRPTPDGEVVKHLIEDLSRLVDADIQFFLIEGRREINGDSVKKLVEAGVAEKLTAEPTILDSVALYGIDYTGDEESIKNSLEQLIPSDAFTYNLVCVHEQIWPPRPKSNADVSAYDIMKATDVHVGDVIAGGFEEPRVWKSDDFDYTVSYAGSTNPKQFSAGRTPRGRLLEIDDGDREIKETHLAMSEVEQDLADLKQVLNYRPSDVSDVETETLADLYGMAARAKTMFEDRRTELRDELLDRVDEDQLIGGQHAEVSRRTQQRRNLKAEKIVREQFEQANIDSDEIMSIDSSLVRDFVEDDAIDEDAVFDFEDRSYIRLKEIENITEN